MGLSPKEVEASHDGEAQKEQDVHPCRSKHPRAYKAHKVHLKQPQRRQGHSGQSGQEANGRADNPRVFRVQAGQANLKDANSQVHLAHREFSTNHHEVIKGLAMP